jgi:hypothetical protein
MVNRFIFGLIAIFWVIMNVLLWRSEFSRSKHPGSNVPIDVVWQKILTAPDDSALEIFQQGKRIGRCRWSANVGEELASGKVVPDEFAPEGRVKQLTGYTVDLEGSLLLQELEARLRFNLHGLFSTNDHWQEFSARIGIRPSTWELRTRAADQSVLLKVEDAEGKWEKNYTFQELRNPQTLLKDFGAPALLGFLGGPITLPSAPALARGLKWEARHDWLTIGRSQVRAYRLQAGLFERYQVIVFVSRVGEILRVELPNGIVLVNEALSF